MKPTDTIESLGRSGCYAGTDIMPQDGDIVEWISNGERWTVCKEYDLEGPSALHLWDEGGWRQVRLIIRPKLKRTNVKYDRVCMKCGFSIYQGVLCAACWAESEFSKKDATHKGQSMKKVLFKDSPDGLQLHAGLFRGHALWHSDDGGKTWWCGTVFSHTVAVTREELVDLAVSIIRDVPNAENESQ